MAVAEMSWRNVFVTFFDRLIHNLFNQTILNWIGHHDFSGQNANLKKKQETSKTDQSRSTLTTFTSLSQLWCQSNEDSKVGRTRLKMSRLR